MQTPLLFALVASAILCWLVVDLVRGFLGAAGSFAARVKGAVRHSASIAVAHLVALPTAALGLVAALSDLLGDPSIASAIAGAVPPEWAPWLPLAVALIGYAARLRTARR